MAIHMLIFIKCILAELAAVIDADPVSNDLNEHLNSIVEGRALAGGADNFHAPIAAMAQPPQPIADSKEPIDDLKSDASGWYKYYGYRPPYHSYYRPPSYNNYWPYEHRYNYPYHHNRYPPYDYYGYRPNEFYSGIELLK